MTAFFVLLILGSNHLYGYSLLDSFLDFIGAGSWTKEGRSGWHITSLITIPLLVLCLYQTVRCMRDKYPKILLMMLIAALILSEVYPPITKGIISAGGWFN